MYNLEQQIQGQVVCFLDYNNDLKMDILVQLNNIVSIYLNTGKSFEFKYKLESIGEDFICSDFNQDGRVDLLVSKRTGGDGVESNLYLQNGGGELVNSGKLESLYTMPWIADYYSSHLPAILSYNTNKQIVASVFSNLEFKTNTTTLDSSCEPIEYHSNGFVDLDGDCYSDLVLTCTKNSRQYLQIYTPTNTGYYELKLEEELMQNSGHLSFADLDADGAIDLIWPVCTSDSCKLVVIYGNPIPVCKTQAANGCRQSQDLCVANPAFKLDFESQFVTLYLIESHGH